jgi:hypothetical protein
MLPSARMRVLAYAVVEQPGDGRADGVRVRDLIGEDLRRDTGAFPLQGQEDVLGADVVVLELQRFPQRQLHHLLGALRERDVSRGHAVLAGPDLLLDACAHRGRRDPEVAQCPRRDARRLGEQPEQDVLGADVTVPQCAGFFLCADHH